MKQRARMFSLSAVLLFSSQPGLAADRDDNPPGPVGGPGTNWENPPGPEGGPGASPDRRYRYPVNPPGPVGGPGAGWYQRPYRYRYYDRDNNPPGPRGGPGTNWENPPGPRGGPGASPNRRYRR
ncbi:MAG: hypothetical protein AB2598_08260 [Candidatus Thiodiazotropha sp.]